MSRAKVIYTTDRKDTVKINTVLRNNTERARRSVVDRLPGTEKAVGSNPTESISPAKG